MKKIIVISALLLCLCMLFSSCAKEDVKINSDAGAYYLMFREIAENNADITLYQYLSFDKASTGLEGEELDTLEGLIKDYCEEKGVAYLDMDLTRLKRSFRIDYTSRGEVFTTGYLLSFSNCGFVEDDEGQAFFTGDVELWHGDFDALACLNFVIVKTDKGWYIDRDAENGGYDQLVS